MPRWRAALALAALGLFLVSGVTGAQVRPRLVETGAGQSLHAVTYGDGRFLAVGDGGVALSSVDGERWQVLTGARPGGASLRAVAYGRGLFVAGGTSATLLTSPDGRSWERRELPVGGGFTVQGLAYGQGLFVAVGSLEPPGEAGGEGRVLTSADGVRWVEQPAAVRVLEGTGRSRVLRGVSFGAGRFVAASENAALVSEDGAVWRPAVLEPDCALIGVAYLGGYFVARGSCADVYVSPDGVRWQSAGRAPWAGVEAVASRGCLAVGVSQGGKALVAGLGLAEGGGVADVEVDDTCVAFPDARPVMVEGRTLIPVRALAERGFGYQVRWVGQAREVILTGLTPAGSWRTVVLTVGARTARVDGRGVELQVPAVIRQNRVYVPLRFVAEAFAAEVTWDRELRVVRIRRALPD